MQRLPDPHLTHHVRLFPHRSPQWPSATAAEGGLKPPPEGRLRRACNPSSFMQHRSRSLNQQATSRVRGTQGYAKPRFRRHLSLFRCFRSGRLPCPHLTHHVRLFPRRSPRQSSANAAQGGLKPPPAGRLRRAKPSSLVQPRIQDAHLPTH